MSRIGVAGVVVVFAAGAWLVAAPFVLGYHHHGAGWTGATRTDMMAGGLLAVAGLAGLVGIVAGRVGELYSDARSAASQAALDYRGADGRTTAS